MPTSRRAVLRAREATRHNISEFAEHLSGADRARLKRAASPEQMPMPKQLRPWALRDVKHPHGLQPEPPTAA